MIAALHAAVTWFMTGAVWTIQLVHYPALRDAPPEAFRRNTRRTAPLVIPVMALEAATAVLLLRVPSAAAAAGAALLAVIWVSTALVQYPIHRRLGEKYADADFSRLLRTNWLRVACWSARGLLALALLRRAP